MGFDSSGVSAVSPGESPSPPSVCDLDLGMRWTGAFAASPSWMAPTHTWTLGSPGPGLVSHSICCPCTTQSQQTLGKVAPGTGLPLGRLRWKGRVHSHREKQQRAAEGRKAKDAGGCLPPCPPGASATEPGPLLPETAQVCSHLPETRQLNPRGLLGRDSLDK